MFIQSSELDFNFNQINNHVLMKDNKFIVNNYLFKTKDSYIIILQHAQSLQNCHEKQIQLNICKEITSNCDELVKKINKIIQEIIPLEKEIQDLLINTEKKSTEITEKMNECSKSMRELGAKQANLETKQKELLRDEKESKTNITQMEGELVIGKMLTDIVSRPFVESVIFAPLAPLFENINKPLEDNLARNKTQLDNIQKEQEEVHNNFLILNKEINILHDSLQKLTSTRGNLDKRIKEIGQDLTALRNIEMHLKEVCSRCKFAVIKDVEYIKQEVLEEILDPKEISNFIENIKKIQSIKISES